MEHVFVETNWVVDCCAPAHHRKREAEQLANRASKGELRLHLPAVCLREAARVLSQRFKPKGDDLKAFRKWALEQKKITNAESQEAVRFIESYERILRADLLTIKQRIDVLASWEFIEIFALNDNMLERMISLREIDMRPIDEAILAAILVRADELRGYGAKEMSFCELDGDLQPWDRDGRARQPLRSMYDVAHVWVYNAFDMRWA